MKGTERSYKITRAKLSTTENSTAPSKQENILTKNLKTSTKKMVQDKKHTNSSTNRMQPKALLQQDTISAISTAQYLCSTSRAQNNLSHHSNRSIVCKKEEKMSITITNHQTKEVGPALQSSQTKLKIHSVKQENGDNGTVNTLLDISNKLVHDSNPNERPTAEVQMLKKHNKELVYRLDDTNIRFEKLLQQNSLQKESLDIKEKIIDTLRQELEACNRASMICLDKASSSNKFAILGQNDEVQYKSLKDALSARHSINENQSYSNIVGSCLVGGIGNMNQYDARIKELEHLLKERTDELDNVKEQYAINSDIIPKLRHILQDRNIEIENAETQNQKYLERVKSLEDKVLSLEKAKKVTNDKIDKELQKRHRPLIKRIEEQAKEKQELQEELKDMKEKLERTQSPNVENKGLISHSSGESCCVKDEFTSHEGNLTNIGKENSCKIINVVRKLKKSILNFHLIVRNEIEQRNIFSHLPSLQTTLSNYSSTHTNQRDLSIASDGVYHDSLYDTEAMVEAFEELSALMKVLLKMAQREIETQTKIENDCKILEEKLEKIDNDLLADYPPKYTNDTRYINKKPAFAPFQLRKPHKGHSCKEANKSKEPSKSDTNVSCRPLQHSPENIVVKHKRDNVNIDTLRSNESPTGKEICNKTLPLANENNSKEKKNEDQSNLNHPVEQKTQTIDWKVGDECMAKYYGDDIFYYGIITSIHNSGSAVVLFQEYGNQEVVLFTHILPCDLPFKAGVDAFSSEIFTENQQIDIQYSYKSSLRWPKMPDLYKSLSSFETPVIQTHDISNSNVSEGHNEPYSNTSTTNNNLISHTINSCQDIEQSDPLLNGMHQYLEDSFTNDRTQNWENDVLQQDETIDLSYKNHPIESACRSEQNFAVSTCVLLPQRNWSVLTNLVYLKTDKLWLILAPRPPSILYYRTNPTFIIDPYFAALILVLQSYTRNRK